MFDRIENSLFSSRISAVAPEINRLALYVIAMPFNNKHTLWATELRDKINTLVCGYHSICVGQIESLLTVERKQLIDNVYEDYGMDLHAAKFAPTVEKLDGFIEYLASHLTYAVGRSRMVTRSDIHNWTRGD